MVRGRYAFVAISGAYSYPDTNVLTTANVSQNFACTPPLP